MMLKFPQNNKKSLSEDVIEIGLDVLESFFIFISNDEISDEDVDMLNSLKKYLEAKGIPENDISDVIDKFIFLYT